MRFRSFQWRLLTSFGGLILLVQSFVLATVYLASRENARTTISGELEGTGKEIFRRQLAWHSQRIIEAAYLLSSDFAFKSAYAANDLGTLLSAMQNHLGRLHGSDVMMIVSMEGEVIADTRLPELTGTLLAWPELLTQAENDENMEATATVLLDGAPHEVIFIPFLAPDPVAWILISFPLDENFVQDLARLIESHVSILTKTPAGSWEAAASSLPDGLANSLPRLLEQQAWRKNQGFIGRVGDEEMVTVITMLDNATGVELLVILQRSLEQALQPYRRLQVQLILLLTAGLALSVFSSVGIARGVTRPVRELAKSARNVAEGDYTQYIQTTLRDEIGDLTASFNDMIKGLREKERVRSLLGKIVSPAVAEELLNSQIELGGEEKEVSVLFSDIRNFSALCEQHRPSEVITFLNIYFSRVSAVIEMHGGVIDKFVGDSVMALYGAPVQHENDADRSVATALEMVAVLEQINEELGLRKLPALKCGIGINTSQVLAGNMGSLTRLNYTVVGDGVNLASRLEGLTKIYGVPIIVSESTKVKAAGFVYRELDRIRVKGKQEPVVIYEPLGACQDVTLEQLERLAQFRIALKLYRAMAWADAQKAFQNYASVSGDPLADVFLQRILRFSSNPPAYDWDGVYDHEQK